MLETRCQGMEFSVQYAGHDQLEPACLLELLMRRAGHAASDRGLRGLSAFGNIVRPTGGALASSYACDTARKSRKPRDMKRRFTYKNRTHIP